MLCLSDHVSENSFSDSKPSYANNAMGLVYQAARVIG